MTVLGFDERAWRRITNGGLGVKLHRPSAA